MNLNYLLPDADFEECMQNTVLPYLNSLQQTIQITAHDGWLLNCEYYLLEDTDKIIFISHGFTEYAPKYSEIIYYFLKAGYSVAFMEHRGHGYSGRMLPNDCKVHIDTFDTYVRDFHTFYEQIISKLPFNTKCYLFAHSMGGCIGTLYIEKYPHDFTACILSSPMHAPLSGGIPKFLCIAFANVLELLGKGTHYLGSQAQDYTPSETFEDAAGTSYERWEFFNNIRITDKNYHLSAGTVHWMNRALKDSAKSVKDAAKISIPVLVLSSGNDTYVDISAHKRFVSKCPHASLSLFKNSKHEIFNSDIDTRRDFYETIFAFLESNS